jgi:ABC-type multidrug transport system ATPase subunit
LDKGQVLVQGSVNDLLSNDTETVQIHTKDINRALQELQNIEFIKSVSVDEGRVIVKLDKGLSGLLNRHLINLGIEVDYLVPINRSLESLYIKLTRGESYDI